MDQECEKKRVYWACRRGMLELDLILIPFFEKQYATLCSREQTLFAKLLTCHDPELHAWFNNKGSPDDPDLAAMVQTIRTFMQTKAHS